LIIFVLKLIGSSILFVHDGTKASLWMIDFGKTTLLPDDIHTTHSKSWTRGSHEDGYLVGLDNLISLFREIIDELKLTLPSN
jgi:1D-myo-inositol-triphosphate 3-kinase